MEPVEDKYIRVELTEATIVRLLADGRLCATDIRSRDCRLKQCIWRLCLQSCLERGNAAARRKVDGLGVSPSCSRHLGDS